MQRFSFGAGSPSSRRPIAPQMGPSNTHVNEVSALRGFISHRPSTRAERGVPAQAKKAISGEVEDFKARIERSFNARARSYDMLDEFHPALALKLVSVLKPQPGEHVLDIASGTGHVSIECRERVGDSGRVVANDISALMLQQQELKLEFYDFVGKIEMLPGDADKLTFGEEFDIIACATALPFFPDINSTLKKWHSMLKPGGRAGFNAFKTPMNPDNGLWCEMARSDYGLKDLEEVNARLGTEKLCREAMAAAGFTSVEITAVESEQSMYGPTLEDYADKIWRMSVNSPFWPVESQKLLTEAQIAEFKAKFIAKTVENARSRYDGEKFIKNPYTVFYVVGRK